MGIYTFDQVIKKTGVKPTEVQSVSVPAPAQEAVPKRNIGKETLSAVTSVPSNIMESFDAGIQKAGTGLEQIMTNKANDPNAKGSELGRGILNLGGGLLETVFSPIGGTLKSVSEVPGISDSLGLIEKGIVNPAADLISNVKAIQDFAVNNPNAEEVFSNGLNILTSIYGGKKAPEIRSAFENTKIKTPSIPVETIKDTLKTGVEKGKAVVDKASDIITPIEKGVETQLDPTKLIPKEKLVNIPEEKIVAQAENKTAKLEKYNKAAEEAVSDYSKPTPLAIAGQEADKALNVINNKLKKQSTIKNEALGEVGDRPVSGVAEIRTNLQDTLKERVGVEVSITDEGFQIKPAPGRASKIAFDPADNTLIKDAYQAISQLGDSPTVRMIDDTVDALQDMLYKRKSTVAIPVNGQVEGVLKAITGKLNSMVKKVAGEQYTKANSKYAYFVEIRDALNKALGAEGVRGASLMKQLFSPSAEAPRRLFADIKKLTGIDLVEEATFAKFVMEKVGDARQASLLEEVIRGRVRDSKSLIEGAFNVLLDKIQDPINKARRTIEKSKPEPSSMRKTNTQGGFVKNIFTESQRDAVASKLSKLDSADFVNSKGKLNVDAFAETENILSRIEKNKDTAEDIMRAQEILALLKKE